MPSGERNLNDIWPTHQINTGVSPSPAQHEKKNHRQLVTTIPIIEKKIPTAWCSQNITFRHSIIQITEQTTARFGLGSLAVRISETHFMAGDVVDGGRLVDEVGGVAVSFFAACDWDGRGCGAGYGRRGEAELESVRAALGSLGGGNFT